jgi:hypothetical protein
MKKKTAALTRFINSLHEYIVNDPQFRKKTIEKAEEEIQREIRPLVINYLTKYFKGKGYKDPYRKACKSFYWEGQEGTYGKERKRTFGARNYPDFIITAPYLIALEYKQSVNGGVVKQGIGQSIMHTLSGDFHYVYYLFHDQNSDKKIKHSLTNENEKKVINMIWRDFNVYMKFI